MLEKEYRRIRKRENKYPLRLLLELAGHRSRLTMMSPPLSVEAFGDIYEIIRNQAMAAESLSAVIA